MTEADLNLKTLTQDGNEIFFLCKVTTPLGKLMNAYCQRQGVRMQSVRFLFDGARITAEQTPKELDMEDGDTIDVMAEDYEPDVMTDDQINLKTLTQDGNEIFYKCKVTTPLGKLMNAFCQRQGVRMQSVRFLFDGARITAEQTPKELDMEDDDTIDVMENGLSTTETTPTCSEAAELASRDAAPCAPPQAEAQAEAHCKLGFRCADGDGVEQDFVKAARLFGLAAAQGHARAQAALGCLYYKGLGVPQDIVEAERLLRLAATHGDARGQYSLAALYFEGKGVAQDSEEAVRLLRLAAAQGCVDAQSMLASLYGAGVLGVALDDEEASRLFEQATAQGDAKACLMRDLFRWSQGAEGGVRSFHGLMQRALAIGGFDEAVAAVKVAMIGERAYVSACCSGCGATRKLKTCAKCKVARFCNAECVRKAWAEHKPHCMRWEAEEAAAGEHGPP